MSRFVSLLLLAASATAWIAPVPAGTRAGAPVVPAATRVGRTTLQFQNPFQPPPKKSGAKKAAPRTSTPRSRKPAPTAPAAPSFGGLSFGAVSDEQREKRAKLLKPVLANGNKCVSQAPWSDARHRCVDWQDDPAALERVRRQAARLLINASTAGRAG